MREVPEIFFSYMEGEIPVVLSRSMLARLHQFYGSDAAALKAFHELDPKPTNSADIFRLLTRNLGKGKSHLSGVKLGTRLGPG